MKGKVEMKRSLIWKVILAIVVVGMLVGLGVLVFNAGVSRGLAGNPFSEGAPRRGVTAPFYFMMPHMGGFFGSGIITFFVVLILVFLVFAIARALFWRGPRDWHAMRHGAGEYPVSGDRGETTPPVPTYFEEWHRKLHENQPPAEHEKKPE